jgi:hypothetical protein
MMRSEKPVVIRKEKKKKDYTEEQEDMLEYLGMLV